MNICATCTHWREIDSDTNSALARLGVPRHGVCGIITDGLDDDRASLNWRVRDFARDVTIDMWLETRSDFGCMLWESR